MATKLILIRHGETEWNLKTRYCGFNDIGLNATGRRQAKKIKSRLKNETIHKFYSSDRRRAIETAKIIFNGTIKIEKIKDLREINFGCFEGLTHEQVTKKYPQIYQKWLRDPHKNNIPEGENISDFKKRVVSAIKKIIALNHNKTTALVFHGGSISIFLTSILKKDKFWQYIPRSASISIVEYKKGKPKINLLNDTAHLYG